MVDFLYIGEYPNGESITMVGVVFCKGAPSTVVDADSISKLRGNRFFKEIAHAELHQSADIGKDTKAHESAGFRANGKRGRQRLS